MAAQPSDFRFPTGSGSEGAEQLRRILEFAFAANGARRRFPITSIGRTPPTDSGAAHEGHMKGMASAPDYYIPPAEGPHPGTVIAAEPGLSKKNNSQIKVSVQLDATGEVLEDYLGTDGTVKGAGMSKAKFRGLGIDVTSDAEQPDEVIAAALLGRKTIVEVEHENAEKKDEGTNAWVPMTHFDPITGNTIQLKRARVKGFRLANVGGVAAAPVQQAPQQYAAQAPQQFPQSAAQPPFAQPQQAPQGYTQPPAQYAPPAAAAAAPPQQWQQPQAQYAPPVQQQPQYAPAPQQQYAPPPGPAFQQPQYAQPAPNGYAPQAPQAWAPPPGAPQVQYAPPPQVPQPMQPVQMQPPAPPQGVPWPTAPETPAETEKKKRGRPPNPKPPEGAPQS